MPSGYLELNIHVTLYVIKKWSSMKLGLMWLNLIVPVSISRRVQKTAAKKGWLLQIEYSAIWGAFWGAAQWLNIHTVTCTPVCLYTASRVSSSSLPSVWTCSLKSPRRRQFFSLLLFKQLFRFEVQHEAFILLSCYFIVFPLRNAMQHPGGYNKYPGPSLSSITQTRPTMMVGNTGRKKNVHFMFELEQRGVSSWPYTVMTSLINQMHNSWDGKVCCEGEKMG